MQQDRQGGPLREQGSGGNEKGQSGCELAQQATNLVDGASAIDFRISDEPGALTLAAVSAPVIVDLLGQVLEFLDQAQSHYAAVAARAAPNSDSLGDIGALISTEIAVQEIRDLCFVASGEIRSLMRGLQSALASQNLLAMVSGADGALCGVRHGLIPIETAIGEFEGIEPPDREWNDIETTLQIRRLYGWLRRELKAVGQPDDRDLTARLSEFTNRLSELRSNDAYAMFRVNDRVQIRALFRRIVLWLDEEESDLSSGRRIWQDLSGFINLLAEINKRQELQEHDRRVIDVAYHALFANVRPPRVIPGDLLAKLRTLEGRDDELDALILHATSRCPKDWESPIRRLWQSPINQDLDQAPLGLVGVAQ